MTATQPTRRGIAAIDHYVAAVFREVVRLASKVRHGFDADDIAAEVAAGVLDKPEVIMARYPDPARYARVRARHAGISFDRGQRAQRGEGARLFQGPDGLFAPGRRYVSGNSVGPDGGDELLTFVVDPTAAFEAGIDDHMVDAALLRRCCKGLSQGEVREVWLVDGCGHTVQEMAELCGQRRETVSRRLNNTRGRIRQNRVEMLNEQESLK
jgi:DNA-directed RNA polymerase specialized sigma24 family protein